MAKSKVEGKEVTITHNTTCKDTEKALQGEKQTSPSFVHVFDFSNCTEEQVLTWAGENRLIAWRARNKPLDMSEEEVRALESTIDCATAFVSRARKAKVKDPIMVAMEELAMKKGITVEELARELKITK